MPLSLLLQNALTEHVIPKLPDVTQIPDSSWPGWDPIFRELQVDRNNTAQVQETISRCQATLTNLLQAAIMNGQQAFAQQMGDPQVCNHPLLLAQHRRCQCWHSRNGLGTYLQA